MRSAERVLIFGGPGGTRALTFLLASLLLAGLVRAHHHLGNYDKTESLQDQKDEDYQKLTDRLDFVTGRLERLDRKLDTRLSSKLQQKARSLEHRVSSLEEDHCDKNHYDCGGQDHECVSRLMVCDGRRDCRNGDDEKHCTLPTNMGDRFIGYKVYDDCDEGHMSKATLVITEVKVRPAFPGFPMLRAVVHSVDDDDEDRIEIAYQTVGYYRFNTHKLVLLPPAGSEGSNGLGIIFEFDGHDMDTALAKVVNQVSLRECAQFMFFREKKKKKGGDDDEEEEHDDKFKRN